MGLDYSGSVGFGLVSPYNKEVFEILKSFYEKKTSETYEPEDEYDGMDQHISHRMFPGVMVQTVWFESTGNRQLFVMYDKTRVSLERTDMEGRYITVPENNLAIDIIEELADLLGVDTGMVIYSEYS